MWAQVPAAGRGLFDFTVGGPAEEPWVTGYAYIFMTDIHPPFRLGTLIMALVGFQHAVCRGASS